MREHPDLDQLKRQAKELLEAFRVLAGKLTIVMVAHRLSALANCDQLLDLSKMRVALLEIRD